MNVVNRFLFLSCIKATEAVEKRQVVGLTILEKIRLQKHLSVCHACNMYATFSKKADSLIQKIIQHETIPQHHSTTELEEKVLKNIFLK